MSVFPLQAKRIEYGAGKNQSASLSAAGLAIEGVLVMAKQVKYSTAPRGEYNFKVSFQVKFTSFCDLLGDDLIFVGSVAIKDLATEQDIVCLGYFPLIWDGIAGAPTVDSWLVSFDSERDFAGRKLDVVLCPIVKGTLTGLLPGAYLTQTRALPLPPPYDQR